MATAKITAARMIDIGVDMAMRIDLQRDILARKFVAMYKGTSIEDINKMTHCAIEHDAHLFIREKYEIEFQDLPTELHNAFHEHLFSKTIHLTPGGHAHIDKVS